MLLTVLSWVGLVFAVSLTAIFSFFAYDEGRSKET